MNRVPVQCGLPGCVADATLFYKRDASFVRNGPGVKEYAARCAGHAGNKLHTDSKGDWTIGTYEDCAVAEVMEF